MRFPTSSLRPFLTSGSALRSQTQTQIRPQQRPRTMTTLALGLGLLGAGLGSRVAWQMYRSRMGMAAADKWVKGGFQNKMDRSEAMKVLGLK